MLYKFAAPNQVIGCVRNKRPVVEIVSKVVVFNHRISKRCKAAIDTSNGTTQTSEKSCGVALAAANIEDTRNA